MDASYCLRKAASPPSHGLRFGFIEFGAASLRRSGSFKLLRHEVDLPKVWTQYDPKPETMKPRRTCIMPKKGCAACM